MSETRQRIADRVERDPGIHFSALVRDLDLGRGQVQYHLRRLRTADAVLAEELYGRTHYYPDAFDDWERGALALLRRETAREVVLWLLANGPDRPATVADDLGIARSTLEWHLDNLVERDLVEKRRDEGDRVTLAATRPDATARLLGEVDASVPDRLVDRFARLVDSLLEE
ncbi:winged helix-turn-helix transcriptional regulator [Halorientalis salina]|uniref:winged helix-turn-helix transcriptional regulator n=1 Tax=Halorientalis salina TaxID=2932266 RepID=UPI0010ACF69C|nr:ArsR family transcriptional regulator [Halorientalis salina]